MGRYRVGAENSVIREKGGGRQIDRRSLTPGTATGRETGEHRGDEVEKNSDHKGIKRQEAVED